MVIKEVETPKPDGFNVIMKVTNVGICGSDIIFGSLAYDLYNKYHTWS
jgi:threonine dehydrogenase-like Zn-dependent dehydrogenase